MTVDNEDRYPLWCVDTYERSSENRYWGPYVTRDEAKLKCDVLCIMEHHPEAKIRRCRRVQAAGLGFSLDELIERADEDTIDTVASLGAWARWDGQVVDAVDHAAAEKALADWANTHLRVAAFVCEGDESPSNGGKDG